MTAGDADTLTSAIDASMKAKVPILTFDSDSPKSHRLLFVGTNNYNAGYQASVPSAPHKPGAKLRAKPLI